MMRPRTLAKYWLYNSVPGFAGRLPYFGTAVHFPKDALLLRIVCEQGIFEGDVVRRMISLAKRDTTVIDVGANLGLMSIPVLQSCSTCRMISFEPSPSSLPFLQKTANGSVHGERWTVVGKALAGEPGEMDFTVGAAKDALYEGFKSGDRISGGRVVRVPVVTLDGEWRRLGEPDVSVVKVDVEGAEGGVLAGAHALFEQCRPAILVEWFAPYLARFGTPPQLLLQVAHRFGYRIFTVPAGVPVDDERALAVQMIDCQNFLLLASP